MAAFISDDDDDDVNRNSMMLTPYWELPIDEINSTDLVKVFTNNNTLYNQLLGRGEGEYGIHPVYQYVDVQLQVCRYYTDGRLFFDEWYVYQVIGGRVFTTLMNDRFHQVVAWWNGPSVVHM